MTIFVVAVLIATLTGALWLRAGDRTGLWARVSGTLSAAEELCREFNIQIDVVAWKDWLTSHGMTEEIVEGETFKQGWKKGYGETLRRLLDFPVVEGEYELCNTLLQEYGERGSVVSGMLVIKRD